ncbi:hypothetical protein C8J56DRAFT_926430 [Mycena floridula]|nr:hypothetical protein C8J56DRAFT_926430 [Mycena floridula]
MTIQVFTERLKTSDSEFILKLQITQLVDQYMLWVGLGSESDDSLGSLCKDWACAMPGENGPASALFGSSKSDIALSMARRLAKRFNKQIFVSVDIPIRFAVEAEQGLVAALKRF